MPKTEKKLSLMFALCRGKVTSACLRKDSKVLLSSGEDSKARIWDPKKRGGQGSAVGAFSAPHEILDVQFTADGMGVLAALRNNIILLWDLRKSEQAVRQYDGHTVCMLEQMCLLPCGSMSVSCEIQKRVSRLKGSITSTRCVHWNGCACCPAEQHHFFVV